MRSRRSAQEQVAEVARRRLELLSAELAEIRPDPVDTPVPGPPGGSGELLDDVPAAHGPASAVADAAPVRRRGTRHRPVGRSRRASAGWAARPAARRRCRAGCGSGPRTSRCVVLLVGGRAGALTAGGSCARDGGETALPPVPARSVGARPRCRPGGVRRGRAGSGGATRRPPVPPAAARPAATIVVDVTGKVRRPGIATLPLGLTGGRRAGGGRRRAPGVRLGTLNLARVLADGEQIVVGVRGTAGRGGLGRRRRRSRGGRPAARRRWSTSTAPTQAELEALPGRRAGDGPVDPGLPHRERRLHRGRRAARGVRHRRRDAGRDRALRHALMPATAAAAEAAARPRPPDLRAVRARGVRLGRRPGRARAARLDRGWSCVALAAVLVGARRRRRPAGA